MSKRLVYYSNAKAESGESSKRKYLTKRINEHSAHFLLTYTPIISSEFFKSEFRRLNKIHYSNALDIRNRKINDSEIYFGVNKCACKILLPTYLLHLQWDNSDATKMC